MRMMSGWAKLRTSVVALGLALGVVGAAGADTIPSTGLMDYSTSGSIGTTGISGPGVISFNSVASEQLRRAVVLQPGRLPGRRPARGADHDVHQHAVPGHLPRPHGQRRPPRPSTRRRSC